MRPPMDHDQKVDQSHYLNKDLDGLITASTNLRAKSLLQLRRSLPASHNCQPAYS